MPTDNANSGLHHPYRAQQRELLMQLRREQEGKSIPGYADYLQKMEKLDSEMERLSRRDSWNTAKPMDAADQERLQNMIRETAMAGETYLENVRKTEKDGKKISMKKGAPGIVNRLQGVLARDLQTIQLYDPKTPLTLPQLMEQARTKTLILNTDEMSRLKGNQNARIPISLKTPTGEEYRGVFTKATYSRTRQLIQDVINSAVKRAEEDLGQEPDPDDEYSVEEGDQEEPTGPMTEDDVEELRGITAKMRHYLATDQELRQNYPGLAKMDIDKMDDARVFLFTIELHTAKGDRMNRMKFMWQDFARHMGLNPRKYENALREFGSKAVKLRYKTTDQMINTLDLGVEEGARIDSRNSAMSAVADLLGVSNLLARSTNMRFADNQGNIEEGTVMDFSKGLDLNDDRSLFAQVNDNPFGGAESWNALKQMADMQTLDFICGNVDRHAGNLMYLTNDAGDIVGVQGIDNDSSFGNFATGNARNNRLPGLGEMNCISQSMCNTIMKTDPAMLRFSLRGRNLSEKELDFAVKRLEQIKEAIIEGREHYKNHPKIDDNTEKPFDKGFLRVVSDDEFKHLTMQKMISAAGKNGAEKKQDNLFSEVSSWLDTRLETTRNEHDIQYDPTAKDRAKEKELPGFQTQDQVYTGQGLLSSIRGISRVIKHDEHDIDKLTNSWHGTSDQFDEMVESAKRLAEMEQKLEEEVQQRQANGHVHYSAVEYSRLREPIARAKEELGRKTDAYLAKKMREKHVTSLDQLRGKNPYERARIQQAKDLSAYVNSHTVSPQLTAEIHSGKDPQAMEIRLAGEISAEEEAEAAMKMLRAIHDQHGLRSPEEMRGMKGEDFNKEIEQAQKQPEGVPTL
ncbi:MAG: hypothetical protein IJL08_00805 [Oscillospiraceae bacterium]|nr:hypothetical protein [Oscillospiraceae bacterium]